MDRSNSRYGREAFLRTLTVGDVGSDEWRWQGLTWRDAPGQSGADNGPQWLYSQHHDTGKGTRAKNAG